MWDPCLYPLLDSLLDRLLDPLLDPFLDLLLDPLLDPLLDQFRARAMYIIKLFNGLRSRPVNPPTDFIEGFTAGRSVESGLAENQCHLTTRQ